MRQQTAVLYFDAHCPLCAKEIKWLRHLASEQLHFIDIHSLKDNDKLPSQEQLLRRLHLQLTEGWLTGLEATVAAWSYTPFGFLFVPLRWGVMKPWVDKIYEHWANKRYQKRYMCQSCL